MLSNKSSTILWHKVKHFILLTTSVNQYFRKVSAGFLILGSPGKRGLEDLFPMGSLYAQGWCSMLAGFPPTPHGGSPTKVLPLHLDFLHHDYSRIPDLSCQWVSNRVARFGE